MAKGKIFTGARGVVLIEGRKVGYASGCDGGENIQYEEVEVLDNIEVEEHAPVRYRSRLSIQLIRLVGTTLKGLGYFPKTGPDTETHLLNILAQQALTVLIMDRVTKLPIALMEECKAADNNWSLNAGTVSTVNTSFMCIRSRDETEFA